MRMMPIVSGDELHRCVGQISRICLATAARNEWTKEQSDSYFKMRVHAVNRLNERYEVQHGEVGLNRLMGYESDVRTGKAVQTQPNTEHSYEYVVFDNHGSKAFPVIVNYDEDDDMIRTVVKPLPIPLLKAAKAVVESKSINGNSLFKKWAKAYVRTNSV